MANELNARFAFTKLVVRDLERQAQFYRDVMGYGEGQLIEGQIDGRAIREIIFSGPDGRTELIVLAFQDGPAASPEGVMAGFMTQDLAAFEKRVLAAGGSAHQQIGPLEGAPGNAKLAFYKDPEGFLLEVLQMQ